MDDIVVLILTLIFIAAGIFGQMKKRQLPPESADKAPSSGNNFWETLGYKEDEEEPVGISEHLQPVEEVAREDRFHTPGNTMKRDFARDLTPSDSVTKNINVKRKKAFPLKKAIIYSEILNRKYF